MEANQGPNQEQIIAEQNARIEALEASLAEMAAVNTQLEEALVASRNANARAVALLEGNVTQTQPAVAAGPDAVQSAPRAPRAAANANNEPARSDNREGFVKRNGKRFLAVAAIALAGVGIYEIASSDNDSKSDAVRTAHVGKASSSKTDLTESFSGAAERLANLGQPVAKADTTPATPATTESSPSSTTTTTVSASTKRTLNLNRATAEPTVSQAVRELHSTSETLPANIHSIFDAANHPKLSHMHGKMSDMNSALKAGHANTTDLTEGLAFSIAGSPAYSAKVYNELHGIKGSNVLPAGVSAQDALKYNEKFLTDSATKTKITDQLNGMALNYGQRGEKVFAANTMSLNGKEMFVVTGANGQQLVIKIENLCMNIEELLKPVGHTTVTPNTPHTTTPKTPQGHSKTPTSHTTPKTPQGHGKTPTTTPKPTPKNPTGSSTIKTPPVKPVVTHPHPKNDPNTTPAGVPGEPKGSGGQEGVGPAGQPVNPNGTVGGEKLPAPQTQDPTPAPLPVEAAPAPTTPAETGHDNGPAQPVTTSPNTGTTITPPAAGTTFDPQG